MHTAFERADNVDPAGVTSLAISKDHKNVYVGDDKGRVFMWSVSSKPGKGNTVFLTSSFLMLSSMTIAIHVCSSKGFSSNLIFFTFLSAAPRGGVINNFN